MRSTGSFKIKAMNRQKNGVQCNHRRKNDDIFAYAKGLEYDVWKLVLSFYGLGPWQVRLRALALTAVHVQCRSCDCVRLSLRNLIKNPRS